MKRSIALHVAVLAAFLPLTWAFAAQRTITKSEIRSEPPDQTHRRLRDVVWDMFRVEDRRTTKPPQRALTDLMLETRIRATDVPFLCRYDSAWIEFAPPDGRERDAGTRVQAIGLKAQSHFHFVRPPTQGHLELPDHDQGPPDAGCRSLNSSEAAFFAADDEEIATDAVFVFLNLQKALREGRTLPLDCDLFPQETRSCSEVVSSLAWQGIESVYSCDPADWQTYCFNIYHADHSVRITVAGRVHPGPPFGQVVRAKVDGLITLSHPRID